MVDNLIIRGACPHDCPDTCAWNVTVKDGKAIALRGDKNHPFTRGGLCAKVNHYLEERVYDPSRILYPLKNIGEKGEGNFKQVSWDHALEDISSVMKQIIAEDGPTAILPYSHLGTQGLIQSSAGDPFFARLGATRLVRNVCGYAGAEGIAATLGLGVVIHPEDVVHSDFIVLWGTNTVVTNLHFWPFIRKAQKQGATVVVIDPIRTRTAAKADWHIQPLPGTDAALALGMMHVIVADSLYDRDYVENYTLGFDRLKKRLADYQPERVAELTGVEKEVIVQLAHKYAGSQSPFVRLLIGLEHHTNGGMMCRTIACLPALVGAWRQRGGGLLHTTDALFFQPMNNEAVERSDLVDDAIREINMVQLGQALTDQNLDPPIHLLFVYNSNPAVIAPNQNLVMAGLKQKDLFTVVHEQFMTDTARFADYVLPATTQVEQLDLNWSWGHTYLTLNQPAIQPIGEAVSNSELFRRLAAALGLQESYLHSSDEARIKAVLDTKHPYFDGITYTALKESGWMPLNLPVDFRPHAEGNFPTPSGKCEFYSENMSEMGLDPLPVFTPPPESPAGNPELANKFPLLLLTGKTALHFLNSSYANIPRHLKAEKEPFLTIHPDDAKPREIRDGDMVKIFNNRGEVTSRAIVSKKVRPSVVSLPSGWWRIHSPERSGANALTADGLSDMGGGGDFHDTLVEVEKLF